MNTKNFKTGYFAGQWYILLSDSGVFNEIASIMLSRRILAITGFILAISAWRVFFESDGRFMLPLVISILAGVMVYTFQHQIDWWWAKKSQPGLPAPMKAMLLQSNSFIHQISPEDSERFEKRMALWVAAKDFIGKGIDKLPEDLKYITAIYPVMLSLYRENFLYEDLGRMVYYPHAFLTPHMPDRVHCYEVEGEDGVMIFSTEQMMVGHIHPKKYYNILLHAFAEAHRLKYPNENYPELPKDAWQLLHRISSIPKGKLDDFIGIVQEDPWPVAVHHYFVYADAFNSVAPALFEGIRDWHENAGLWT